MTYKQCIEIFKKDWNRRATTKPCIQSDVDMYYAEKSIIWTLKYLIENQIESPQELGAEIVKFERLKKHEAQYLNDTADPLEPLKISSALDSEIWKLEHRKKNKPDEINVLDYTIIAALQEALEKRLK